MRGQQRKSHHSSRLAFEAHSGTLMVRKYTTAVFTLKGQRLTPTWRILRGGRVSITSDILTRPHPTVHTTYNKGAAPFRIEKRMAFKSQC